MLLMLKNTHTPENCGLREQEKNMERLEQIKKNLKESNVKVHGLYANNLAHTVVIICEADSVSEIQAVMQPILTISHTEFLPIDDLSSFFA
jgi:uncharacterized protein with GYD domain